MQLEMMSNDEMIALMVKCLRLSEDAPLSILNHFNARQRRDVEKFLLAFTSAAIERRSMPLVGGHDESR